MILPDHVERGVYRIDNETGACRACGSREWRGVVGGQDGRRRLRCEGCGRVRMFPWDGSVTFLRDVA